MPGVKKVHLVVPHSWIYLEVNDDKGEPQVWALEATGRTGLQKVGITADYLKPGDTVKLGVTVSGTAATAACRDF